METFYPSDLPLPKIEGFSAEVASGLIKTETPTHQAQRRVFSTMPHRFSLTFVLSFQKWATWYSWASGNGYRWFDLELPTMYAGMVSADIAPITVRFVSGIVASKPASHVQPVVCVHDGAALGVAIMGQPERLRLAPDATRKLLFGLLVFGRPAHPALYPVYLRHWDRDAGQWLPPRHGFGRA